MIYFYSIIEGTKFTDFFSHSQKFRMGFSTPTIDNEPIKQKASKLICFKAFVLIRDQGLEPWTP